MWVKVAEGNPKKVLGSVVSPNPNQQTEHCPFCHNTAIFYCEIDCSKHKGLGRYCIICDSQYVWKQSLMKELN